jgi:hypothetical protein
MNKQEKYNPDVNKKFEQITKERSNINYTFSKQVYKGITNNFPSNVTNPNDLKIHTDEPNYDEINKRMADAIQERENEKIRQEKLLNELAEKKVSKKLVITMSKSNDAQESFQDMKNSYEKFNVNKNDKLLKEKMVVNDVLDFINKI